MKSVRVFVSSSHDLDGLDDAVGDLLVQLNRFFRTWGIEFLPMLQGEDPAESDVAVVLYGKDFGPLPKPGFDQAYNAFKEKKAPKIYVFFKEPDEGIAEALKAFKESFVERYGHFYCRFEVVDSVKFQLAAQCLSLLQRADNGDLLKVENGEILLGNEAVAKLENLPFAKLNVERNSLVRRIASTEDVVSELEELVKASPGDEDSLEALGKNRKELHDLKEQLKQHDGYLVNMGVFFARTVAQEMDERVQKAWKLFEQGKIRAANRVLDLPELCASADRNLSMFEANRKGCEMDILALLAKAKMVLADKSMAMQARVDNACQAYDKAISVAKVIHWEVQDLAIVLFDYAYVLGRHNRFQKSLLIFDDVLVLFRRLASENPDLYKPNEAIVLNNMAVLYDKTQQKEKAEKKYEEALKIILGLVSRNPEAHELRLLLANAWNNLAILHDTSQQQEKAGREYDEAIKVYRGLASGNSKECKLGLAGTLRNFAKMRREQGQLPDAKEKFSESLKILQSIGSEKSEMSESDLASTLVEFANLYVKILPQVADSAEDGYVQARAFLLLAIAGEAEEKYSRALEILRRLEVINPEVYKPRKAEALSNIAFVHCVTKNYVNSEGEYEESLENWRFLVTSEPIAYEASMAKTLYGWALLKQAEGDDRGAREKALEAVELYKRCDSRTPGLYSDALEKAQSIADGRESGSGETS